MKRSWHGVQSRSASSSAPKITCGKCKTAGPLRGGKRTRLYHPTQNNWSRFGRFFPPFVASVPVPRRRADPASRVTAFGFFVAATVETDGIQLSVCVSFMPRVQSFLTGAGACGHEVSLGRRGLVLCKQTTRVPGVGLWNDAGGGCLHPQYSLWERALRTRCSLKVSDDGGSPRSSPLQPALPGPPAPRCTADEPRPPDLWTNLPSVLGSLRDLHHTLISQHIKSYDLKDSVFIL